MSDAMNCGRIGCYVKSTHTHEVSTKEPKIEIHSCNQAVIDKLQSRIEDIEKERDTFKTSLEEEGIERIKLLSRIENLEKALKEIAAKYVDLNVCSLCGNIWKAIPEITKIAKKALSEGGEAR